MANEAHLLVHCHAGVSRSTAAAILVMAQTCPDRPADEVLREVVRLRPRAWPNLRILEFGDEILGRHGEIVEAARAHYRRALEREPWLAEAMIDGGRGREVAAAACLKSISGFSAQIFDPQHHEVMVVGIDDDAVGAGEVTVEVVVGMCFIETALSTLPPIASR